MLLVVPSVEDLAELLGEFVVTIQGDIFGHGHGGGSDVAGYAGHGVSIATKGDGANDGIHEVGSFEEAYDGFGYALVAGVLFSIRGANLIGGAMEIVAEGLLDVRTDVFFRRASPVQENGSSHGLGSTDAFWRVVSNFSSGPG